MMKDETVTLDEFIPVCVYYQNITGVFSVYRISSGLEEGAYMEKYIM